MISLTKKSVLDSVLAAGLAALFASHTNIAHAGVLYQISVGEATFGPAGAVPYNNGIIQDYATNPDGPTNIPQFAGFQYSDANHEINGVDGGYKVTAEASNAHGGTAHAYAFGDGGFSGYSTSRDANGISDPQQGYTEATVRLQYSFKLVGPASLTPIRVFFNANAYVKTVGTGNGSVELAIYSDPEAPLVDWQLQGGDTQQTYPGGDEIDLVPGQLYAVFELAFAYGHLPYTDGPFDPNQDSGSADAYVDPTFAVSGQYASLYHFEGLPDDALAAGVPEPSTWGLTLIGFAAAGLLYCRNARSAVA